MRIITGDECGLLKEIIPELCRPPPTDANGGSSNFGAIHAGRARPSATSIQAAAASYGNNATTIGGVAQQQSPYERAVQRLEMNEDAQARERGVISLAFLPPTNNDDGDDDGGESDKSSNFNFAALRQNGIVETWSANRPATGIENEIHITPGLYKKTGGLVESVLQTQVEEEETAEEDEENATSNKGWYTKQPIRPIGMVSTYNYNPNSQQSSTSTSDKNKNPILATCDSIGTISIINASNLSKGVVSTYNAFNLDTTNKLHTPSSSKNEIGTGTLTYTKGRFANTSIATCFALGGSEQDGSGDGGYRLAVGGRERGVRVLDLESGKLLWKAKNLPPDPQTLLQQPMWTTTMQFLHTPTSASNAPTHNLLATGTAHKQVQIYDIRSSAATTRRPVLYTPEHLLTHRITSLCQLQNGNTLAIGDSTGDVHLLDMRKMHSGKQFSAKFKHAKEDIGLGRLVGPGGSIRQLYNHPTLPYLACVGLDRKLWTWDVNRRKMMDCVYLKQRLNCLLVCEDESWNIGDGNDEDEDDDGEEYDMQVEENEEGAGQRDLEDDEVEDYVGSDNDDDEEDVNNQVQNKSGSSSEETASGSEEEEGSGDDDASTSEEEEPAPAPASNRNKKRRKA